MANNFVYPNHYSSRKGSNILSTVPTMILEVRGSPYLGHEPACEVTYEHIWGIQPITCWYVQAIRLIPGVQNILHFWKKKEMTSTVI